MMYRTFFFVLLIFTLPLLQANRNVSNDSLEYLLNLIDHKAKYMAMKERHINELETALTAVSGPDSLLYAAHKRLHQAYATYKSDSAIYYANQNLALGIRQNNTTWVKESKLTLASLYLTGGMYIDSYHLLNEIDSRGLPNDLLIKFYDTWKQFYKFYAFNNPNRQLYLEKSNAYRDSLLAQLDPLGNHYKIVYAEKLHDQQDYGEAKKLLISMLDGSKDEDHERAVLAYALASVYQQEGNIEMQKKYYTISAICDIKNAIKENAAMQALASLLYSLKQVEAAYKCITSSMDDAMFGNARLRTYEVSKIFPIIDSTYQETEAKRKSVLTTFLTIVCILSLFLILAVIYVYLQMRRIARVRQQLSEMNKELQRLNAALQKSNDDLALTNAEISNVNVRLTEANQIKETYIGQFLDLCSVYINKLEGFQLSIKKMVMTQRMGELTKTLKSRTMIDREIKELYTTFDHIFLQLYPNFVEDFNSLLQEGEQLVVKPNEVLSTELRIFALIRLGITDSSKIANFLHYSTNTIYTYRTKIRNKAAVPRDEFDDLVMKIGRINKIG
ncbi:hypothetical protein GCM10007415_25920 [Parapedobacter pyrenivorans]|uniref:DUF6377 domain-containing protein n=1 Tax=Parapedobacter pyrenivorans TaxID=1305674 RepID=A0A917HTV3_9SPHI|nr:DUF6377 domain-containing protein [Parapedobacter pyrenivorans]GGG90294.1 hypothetical protein GCM10007415_25920 [Parapedobacter pyrenivorans]